MIESVRFKNFKGLRDTTLPLGHVTVIVGPNGSGKSTALAGLQAVSKQQFLSNTCHSHRSPMNAPIEVEIKWGSPRANTTLKQSWDPAMKSMGRCHLQPNGEALPESERLNPEAEISGLRVYSFVAAAIVKPVTLQPHIELGANGENLAVVLDQMRDSHPERFDAINQDLRNWLPEFDKVLFETPSNGVRNFLLRIGKGGSAVPAADLSEGTLLSLALLTLSHLPSPPTIVALEEPDRGVHPRLLRQVQDAIYHLAYPDSSLDSRPPVQVIATTHSPYFLSLFRDHPEEVVIAEKLGLDATFHRLSDRADIDEILQDASLGDIWYSGILGGVPARS